MKKAEKNKERKTPTKKTDHDMTDMTDMTEQHQETETDQQMTVTETQQLTQTETDDEVRTENRARTTTTTTEKGQQMTVDETRDPDNDATEWTENDGDSDSAPRRSGRTGQRKNYADINKGRPDTRQDNGHKTHHRQTSTNKEIKATETKKTDNRQTEPRKDCKDCKAKQTTIDKMLIELQRNEEKIRKLNRIIDNNNQDRDRLTTTKNDYDREKETRTETQKELMEEKRRRKEAEKREQTMKKETDDLKEKLEKEREERERLHEDAKTTKEEKKQITDEMTRQNRQTVKCNRDLADQNDQLRKAMKRGEETIDRIRQEKNKTEQDIRTEHQNEIDSLTERLEQEKRTVKALLDDVLDSNETTETTKPMTQTKDDKTTILLIGDSNLKEIGENLKGQQYKTTNLTSVRTYTTEELKATVLKTSKTKYDIAYIHVGTNNIRQNENATDIYNDILTATKNLKINNDRMRVTVLTPPPIATTTRQQIQQKLLTRLIETRNDNYLDIYGDDATLTLDKYHVNKTTQTKATERLNRHIRQTKEEMREQPTCPPEQDRYRQTTETETRQQKQTPTYKTPTRLTEDKKTPNRTYQEQQKTKTPNAQQRTDTLTIPKDMMPHFIGKGAANLKRLTKKYQVTINYETDGTIKVTGTPTNNEMTITDIQNTLTTVRQYRPTPPPTLRLTQERKRQIDPTSEEDEDEQTSKRRWMHERRVSGDTF